jgi:bifunctional DNA-binding transcriptional regulator/antitoxin component of YhaV-PrlF toxin-antitoxin module
VTSNTIQVRKKGSFTLPVELRIKYGVDEGDVFTLIDMGDGSFLLTPRIMQVNRLGDRVAEILSAEGVSLDDLLNTLDQDWLSPCNRPFLRLDHALDRLLIHLKSQAQGASLR